jgi:ubiquinone/menaquinone biosynthesis C-methylase UbiE
MHPSAARDETMSTPAPVPVVDLAKDPMSVSVVDLAKDSASLPVVDLAKDPAPRKRLALVAWIILMLVPGWTTFTASLIRAEDAKPVKPKEDARRTYMGRLVAEPMSHMGAAWLIRDNRDDEENASESFKQLGLKEGMSVCDLGCGNGYWTIPMARAVGKMGKVYAVDIQREMLQKLAQRSDGLGIQNVVPVLGKVDDPKLPADSIDLLLMVDVYHEFSHPQSMLWSIRQSLRREGVVALLEYREEDPTVPIKPRHKMSKQQIMKEYEANGFKLVREYNDLPWQHLMYFARDDSPLESIKPVPAEQVLEKIHQGD